MGNRPPLDASLIAPCGMNCWICMGYLRDKNHCPGCRGVDNYNNERCVIRKCESLGKTGSGFCSECERFPCARMKQLDKRYRTRYAMSMFDNLTKIREAGMDEFIRSQEVKYTCKDCGGTICVHRGYCWSCRGKGQSGGPV